MKSDPAGDLWPDYLPLVLAMLSSMISCTHAVLVLLKARRLHECVALRRTLWEALVNIYYVLDDPTKSTERFWLWALDESQDVHNEMELIARSQNTTLEAIAQSWPGVRRWIEASKRAKDYQAAPEDARLQKMRSELGSKHHVIEALASKDGDYSKADSAVVRLLAATWIAAKRDPQHRSWRQISMREKEEALGESPEMRDAMRYVRLTGSARIHFSGSAKTRFLIKTESTGYQPCYGPVSDPELQRSLWFTSLGCLLNSARRVAEAFYIDGLTQDFDRAGRALECWSRKNTLGDGS